MSRPPLDVDAITAQLADPFVTRLAVVDETDSTNAELVRAAAAGAPEGTVLVAEWQSAGRGRFDRIWVSPSRAGLTFSMIVRPGAVPASRWSWLPLLSGLAVRAAVQSLVGTAAPVVLKWPNDLLVGAGPAKAAGILAEVHGTAVIIGIGVNVTHTADELPSALATSLALAFPEQPVDRAHLLVCLLEQFALRYRRWRAAGGDVLGSGLHAEYVAACATIGQQIEMSRAGGRFIGRAVGVDEAGWLIVDSASGQELVSAADVLHVRIDGSLRATRAAALECNDGFS